MKRPLPLLLALLAALSVTGPIPVTVAQSGVKAPAKATVDPAAKSLIEESAKAYLALHGLSMEFTVTQQMGDKTHITTGTLAFSRPDKAKVTMKSGGRRITSLTDGKKFYGQIDASPYERSHVEDDENAIDSLFQSLPDELGIFISSLASGFDLLTEADPPWENVTLLPDGRVSLRPSSRVGQLPMLYILSFDPTDKLLRRVDATGGNPVGTNISTATLTNFVVNPQFSPNEFSVAPGSKIVEAEPMYDPRLKVGTAPFALKGKDLQGQTHPWSRYRGKVVLLDFWATWCGPCIEDLPNVLETYKKYHARGFEILGVSLDGDKKALTNVIAKRGMSFPQIFDGKGWGSVDAATYGVKGIPFCLLIGKDGKIAAVDPRGEELEDAVNAALAVKYAVAKTNSGKGDALRSSSPGGPAKKASLKN